MTIRCFSLISKKHNGGITPPIKEMRKTKEECYPEDISITETYAEVKIQWLVNHPANRLIRDRKTFF